MNVFSRRKPDLSDDDSDFDSKPKSYRDRADHGMSSRDHDRDSRGRDIQPPKMAMSASRSTGNFSARGNGPTSSSSSSGMAGMRDMRGAGPDPRDMREDRPLPVGKYSMASGGAVGPASYNGRPLTTGSNSSNRYGGEPSLASSSSRFNAVSSSSGGGGHGNSHANKFNSDDDDDDDLPPTTSSNRYGANTRRPLSKSMGSAGVRHSSDDSDDDNIGDNRMKSDGPGGGRGLAMSSSKSKAGLYVAGSGVRPSTAQYRSGGVGPMGGGGGGGAMSSGRGRDMDIDSYENANVSSS